MGNFIRARQRVVTAISPHNANPNALIPKRSRPLFPPVWESVPNPPDGEVGTAYVPYDLADDIEAGAREPITYTIETGPLPAGLTLTGSVIDGTPTADGTSSGITVRAENFDGFEISGAFDIAIAAAPP